MHTHTDTHARVHLAEQSELLIVKGVKTALRDDSCIYIYVYVLFILCLQVTNALFTVNRLFLCASFLH